MCMLIKKYDIVSIIGYCHCESYREKNKYLSSANKLLQIQFNIS